MKIDIVAVGTFCNSWPNLVVEVNNETLFDGTPKLKIMLSKKTKLSRYYLLNWTV